MELLPQFVEELEKLKCTKAFVGFSGGGDDGDIYGVTFLTEEGGCAYPWHKKKSMERVVGEDGAWVWKEVKMEDLPPEPTFKCKLPETKYRNTPPYYYTEYYEKELTLSNAIEEYVNYLLEDSNVDWINNDGGSGDWSLVKEDGVWKEEFYIDQHYTESRRAHEAVPKHLILVDGKYEVKT